MANRPPASDILLIELDGTGHHFRFVLEILRALAARGLGPVTLLTTQAALAQPQGHLVAESGLCREIATIAKPAKKPFWRRALDTVGIDIDRWRSWQYAAIGDWFRRNDGEQRFRAVFIPYLDKSYLTELALAEKPFGAVPFGGIIVNPNHHFPAMGLHAPRHFYREWRDRWVYGRLVANHSAGALFALDPNFARYAGEDRVRPLPDPALMSPNPVPPDLRARLGIPPTAVVLLAYGDMRGRRKNIAEAVRAAADPRVPQTLVLLVAGRGEPEGLPGPELEKLRGESRFIRIDRFVDDDLERGLFEIADIVWVNYRDHDASSGVLVNAGHLGKPIVASSRGLVGQLVAGKGMGLVADPGQHEDLIDALTQLTQDRALRERSGNAARAHFSGNTAQAFTSPIVDWLARVQG